MVETKGVEPLPPSSQLFYTETPIETTEKVCTHRCAQIAVPASLDLAKVVVAWEKLSAPLKAAILAIVQSVTGLPSPIFPDMPPPVSGETTHPAELKESK